MKKLVLKKKSGGPDPVWIGTAPNAHEHPGFELNWMNAQLEGASDYLVRQAFTQMYGKPSNGSPEWIARMALTYGAIWCSAKRRSNPLTATERRRFELCRALDVEAMKKETDMYKYMDCELNLKGGSTMSKKNGSKKSARVTASSVLIPILSRASVPANDEIIDTVKDATGSTKFDAAQLAWYMWKFRQGKLKGMDGKQHVINQKSGRKAAVKKSKKVVVRKHTA